MYSIIRLIHRAAARGALVAVLLLLSASSAMAHNTNLSQLEIRGPWSKNCPTFEFADFIKNDAIMRQAMRLAWTMSHEGTADEHEVGFIAYQERRKTSGGYEYRTVIRNAVAGSSSGGGTEVNLPPPIKAKQYRVVMLFHTHPGPASEHGGGYNDYPSDTDFENALDRGIPSGIAHGSGPTWNDGDYIAFGGSSKDRRGNMVTSATPGAKVIELEVEDKNTGKVVTKKYWYLGITQSAKKWKPWSCQKPVKVTGNATSWLGNSGASGDRLTKRTIRAGADGLETVEAPHPAASPSQLPSLAGMEQAMAMAGQSMTPEQLAKMEEAMKGAMANPMVNLAMNSGWVDRERVEFIPLEDEPVVCRTSLKKTYPSFMSGGQDQVTGVSSVTTTFTPLPESETGFAFVTVQEVRANAIGRMEGSGSPVMTRSKASAGASAVIDGTIELEYSQAASLELDLSLSQRGSLSSPDPAMIKPPLKPGKDLYWETTVIVADQDGRMVDLLRFPRLTCPVNSQVAETLSMPLPLPPEGQSYTATLDCSQQGGNYSVGGPGTVPGGWTTVKVTIKGQATAALAEPQGGPEPEPEPEVQPDFPVS